jgi:hypothetical protein
MQVLEAMTRPMEVREKQQTPYRGPASDSEGM